MGKGKCEMCRLGGVVLTNGPRPVEQYREIAEDLLMLIVNMERALGGDGNSIAFHYPNGSYHIIKEHRPSNRLFSRYEEIVKRLQGAIIVQCHARLSTCGPSEQHENMHPFVHGDVVGCHNGQIEDQSIWEELEKLGHNGPYSTTDSEAIFAALDTFAHDLHPKSVQPVIDMLHGTYAITAVSKARPDTLFMLAGSNPLCYWHSKTKGILWYASTPSLFPDTLNIPMKKKKKKTWDRYKKQYIETTVKELDVYELEEGEGVYIKAGKKRLFIESHLFDLSVSYSYYPRKLYYGYGWDDEWDWESDFEKDKLGL